MTLLAPSDLAPMGANTVWRPHAGQQERFLCSSADEALFGGAAGPGKTECLLMESLRQIAHPEYRGILLRRTFPELESADGLIDRSQRWFPTYGGRYNDNKHVWLFPSGSRIYFGHMQYEDDKYRYDGTQFAYVGFDEVTQFSEMQYTYMFTRNRVRRWSGLRVYCRAATNPGNIGHQWVKRRFIIRDIVNRMRWFARENGVDAEVAADHPDARSRAFYPAKLTDNPSIGDNYARNLKSNPDAVLRARLLDGDWDIEYAEGRIFDTWSLDNITSEAEYNPDLPVYWGVDDGYAHGDGPGFANYHPRVIVFVQDSALGGLNVFDEYISTGETYGQTLDRVFDERVYPYRRPSLAWVDGSAAALRAELTGRNISTAIGTHRVSEGIRVVRELICGGDGIRRLRIHPRCENLTYEMPIYRSDPKAREQGGELVPLKLNDHSVDALRYVAYHKRGAH